MEDFKNFDEVSSLSYTINNNDFPTSFGPPAEGALEIDVSSEWSGLSSRVDGEEDGTGGSNELPVVAFPSSTSIIDKVNDKKIRYDLKQKLSFNYFLLTFDSPEIQVKYHRYLALQSSKYSGLMIALTPVILAIILIIVKFVAWFQQYRDSKIATAACSIMFCLGFIVCYLCYYAFYHCYDVKKNQFPALSLDLMSYVSNENKPYEVIFNESDVDVENNLPPQQPTIQLPLRAGTGAGAVPVQLLGEFDHNVERAIRTSLFCGFATIIFLGLSLLFRVFIFGGSVGPGAIFRIPVVPLFFVFYAPIHFSAGLPVTFKGFLCLQGLSLVFITLAYNLDQFGYGKIENCVYEDSVYRSNAVSYLALALIFFTFFGGCWGVFRKGINSFYNRELFGLCIAELGQEGHRQFLEEYIENNYFLNN